MDDGSSVTARTVVLAVGFRYFANSPAELAGRLPAGRFAHTCDFVDFTDLADRRCLILGGRQSAFEWAALLREAGVAEVHLSHRHDSPAFREADWSWVLPLVDRMEDDPGWFRRLTAEERRDVEYRLWAEGRLKVEPWLQSRVLRDGVTVHPRTTLASLEPGISDDLVVTLNDGTRIAVDHIVLATGYKVQMDRVPFLAAGNLPERLETRNGFPVLDEHMETNIPGLFATSMMATQDFGPFFGFTVAARTSARILGAAVERALRPQPTS
jgi:thioredoxin reductase